MLPPDRRTFSNRQLITMSSNCSNFNLRSGAWLKTHFLLQTTSCRTQLNFWKELKYLSPGLSHTLTHVDTARTPEHRTYQIASVTAAEFCFRYESHDCGLPKRLWLCVHSCVSICVFMADCIINMAVFKGLGTVALVLHLPRPLFLCLFLSF